jgi:hypothetical protein
MVPAAAVATRGRPSFRPLSPPRQQLVAPLQVSLLGLPGGCSMRRSRAVTGNRGAARALGVTQVPERAGLLCGLFAAGP